MNRSGSCLQFRSLSKPSAVPDAALPEAVPTEPDMEATSAPECRHPADTGRRTPTRRDAGSGRSSGDAPSGERPAGSRGHAAHVSPPGLRQEHRSDAAQMTHLAQVHEARERQGAAEERERSIAEELHKVHEQFRALSIAYRQATLKHGQEVDWLRQEATNADELRRALEETNKLLETRTTELRDAQAYLGTTDSVSHADVLGLLQKLNAEILQICAHVAETLVPNIEPNPSAVISDSLTARVIAMLGAEGHRCLSSLRQGTGDTSFVVQIALQTCLTRVAEVLVSAWQLNGKSGIAAYVDGPSTPSAVSLLINVHEAIFQNEPQAVSARWRKLTRRYIQTSSSPIDPAYSNTVCLQILEIISDVLRAAGLSILPKDPALYGETAVVGKLKNIIQFCLHLREYIGEHVSSSDFSLLCPRPGVEFNAQWMHDAYGGPGEDKNAKSDVLFVTELGLRRREKVAKPAPGQHNVVEAVPIKAGVFLTTSISELVGECDVVQK